MITKNVKRLLEKLADLDLDRLQELLDYDPEAGVFTWRVRTGPMCKLDKPAGNVGGRGYRRIRIDNVTYPAHHLAWYHFYGEPAEDELDFINLKKNDIRIANLRLASRAENARNMRRNASNSTGFKGVAKFYNPTNRARYRALIRFNNKRIFIGLFHTPEEAYEAYCKKAKELHGEFARVD